MLSRHRLLAVFAHPDDESFLCAGLMAMFVAHGAPVAVVSATRGEAGEIADGIDVTRGNLGEVRERELRAAMHELGIEDVRFLDFLDSGMAGTETNEHPDALAQASTEHVGAMILNIVEELRPTVIITFGAEGIYLHPDHIAIHSATMNALQRAAGSDAAAGIRHLLFAVLPRELFLAIWSRPDNMFEGVPYETVIQMGTPRAQMTHRIDVEAYLDRKLAALDQHRTQFGDRGPLPDFEPDEREEILRFEQFVQHALPWETSASSFPLGNLNREPAA